MKNYTYNDEFYHAGVKGMKWSEEARAKRRGRKRKDTGKTVDVRKRGKGLSGKQNKTGHYSYYGFESGIGKAGEKIRQYRNAALSLSPGLRRKHLVTDYTLSYNGDEYRDIRLLKEKKRRQKVRTDAYKRGTAYSRIRGKKKPGRRMFTEK